MKSLIWSTLASLVINILYVVFKSIRYARQQGDDQSWGILFSLPTFAGYTLILGLIIFVVYIAIRVLIARF